MSHRRVMVLLLLAALAPLSVDAQDKRPARPADFVTRRSASDPQVSPDGRRVAFVVQEPADTERPEEPVDTNIWVVPTDGSEAARPFVASANAESSPRWSPDGQYLAFLVEPKPIGDDASTAVQIHVRRADGGDAWALTAAPISVHTIRWAEDSSAIAFTARDGPTNAERVRAQERNDRIRVDREFKYSRLFVVGLADRDVRRLTTGDVEVTDFTWSPDGTELAALVAPTPRVDDVYWSSRLVVVSRALGDVVRTLSESAPGNVEWSPDGHTIYFHQFTPYQIAQIPALVPAGGGVVRRLLDGYAGTLWSAKWLRTSKQLIGQAVEGTRRHLVHIDAANGEISRADEKIIEPAAFSMSRDGATVAYLQDAPEGPPEVCVSSTAGTKCLTALNPQLANIRLGGVREISWKNPKDGQLIYGVLITPPDYRTDRLYPLVVQVHGGPNLAWCRGWLGSWDDWGQLLASNGYVVLLPNPRGSEGQGWRFVEANRGDLGGQDFQDVLSGVDTLVAQKMADPQRVGIGGWSYGGFMTSWAVTQTDRFKAAIIGAGFTDLFSFHGVTDATPTYLQSYLLGSPYGRRAFYDSRSPMSYVQNTRTPSLLLHGMDDARVPVGQGMAFYRSLKRLGVQAEMVIYPRERHLIRERAHQLDLMTRVLAWYDELLKD